MGSQKRVLEVLRTHHRIAEQQYSGQMRCLGWIVFQAFFYLLILVKEFI